MWVKALLLFFVFSFLFRTDLSFNQDLGRHLRLGEIITQTGTVPKTNLFSYTNPDSPFINTHWLFEVLVYLVNQTVGLQWMLIAKIVVILLSVWLVIKIIPDVSSSPKRKNQVLLLPIGFIFLHVLRERAELRPEIFSFLFTAGTYYILEKFTSESVIPAKTGIHLTKIFNWIPASAGMTKKIKLIFILPLIQFLWINTHIYFFVGLIIQGIFLIHLLYQKLRLHPNVGLSPNKGVNIKLPIIIFILSVLISLINPNGISGLLYPLNVTKNYGYTIVENQTMFLLESIQFRDPNFLFVKLSVGLIVLSLAVTFFRRQFDIKNILLSIGGLVLALMHVRSFPYLVFLSLPATLQNFGAIPWNKLTKTLTIVTATILILESYLYLNGDYYKYRDDQHQVGLGFEENVKGGMDFILTHDLPQPIYNNFDIGSYVLYRGYPKYKVFIDGRPEAYPVTFFHETYIPGQADYSKFKEQEKKWGFQTIIFSHTDQTPWGRNFLQNVVRDEAWKIVYIDDFMIVLVKDEVMSQRKLSSIDLVKLDPSIFRLDSHMPYLRMGLFLLTTGHTESGRQFIGKTLQVFPQSPIANLIIGNPTQNNSFW